MKKEAEFEPVCARIFHLESSMKAAEAELKELKASLKNAMNEESITSDVVGRYQVVLKHIAPTRIVDSSKLKADGLFEKYSKDKAGYDTLSVSRLGDSDAD